MGRGAGRESATAPYHRVRAVVRGMLLRRWGRIINISSPSARMPLAGSEQRTRRQKRDSKGFTRALARDLAPKGVLVNAVVARTDRHRHAAIRMPADDVRALLSGGRARPRRHSRAEVAALVAFLVVRCGELRHRAGDRRSTAV